MGGLQGIRKPLSVLASLKRAQNGIPRLAKTVKEPKRFLMSTTWQRCVVAFLTPSSRGLGFGAPVRSTLERQPQFQLACRPDDRWAVPGHLSIITPLFFVWLLATTKMGVHKSDHHAS